MTPEERIAAAVLTQAERVADRVVAHARHVVERLEFEQRVTRPETPLERERRERGQ